MVRAHKKRNIARAEVYIPLSPLPIETWLGTKTRDGEKLELPAEIWTRIIAHTVLNARGAINNVERAQIRLLKPFRDSPKYLPEAKTLFWEMNTIRRHSVVEKRDKSAHGHIWDEAEDAQVLEKMQRLYYICNIGHPSQTLGVHINSLVSLPACKALKSITMNIRYDPHLFVPFHSQAISYNYKRSDYPRGKAGPRHLSLVDEHIRVLREVLERTSVEEVIFLYTDHLSNPKGRGLIEPSSLKEETIVTVDAEKVEGMDAKQIRHALWELKTGMGLRIKGKARNAL